MKNEQMNHPDHSSERRPTTAAASQTRRSVLQAGAWSVPVLALATSAPQAAASTGARLEFVSPQAGSTSGWIYVDGGTRRFRAVGPSPVRIDNTGDEAFSGSVTVSVRVDNRLLEITGITSQGDAQWISTGAPVVAGNATTTTWTLSSASLAPGESLQIGVNEQNEPGTIEGELPALDVLWTLIAPNSDTWLMLNTPLTEVSPAGVELEMIAPDSPLAAHYVRTDDGNARYRVANPAQLTVRNSGTADLDAEVGFDLEMTVDERLWQITYVSVDGGEPLHATSVSWGAGTNLRTMRWEAIPYAIAAGAARSLTFAPSYIGSELGYSPEAQPVSWEIARPAPGGTLSLPNGPAEPLVP